MLRRGLAALILAAAGGVAAAGPVSNELSALVVIAPPKDAPPSDATVVVGADRESGQGISIWPARALADRANGWVTLTCDVDIHGLAEACRVAYESPRGKGFGAAALTLRPTLKLKPKQGPDGPIDATMNIAVAFHAPATESNLSQLQAVTMSVAPDSGDKTANLGQHDINAGNLILYQNPITTRRVTMMDSTAWIAAPGFDELAAAYPAQGGGVEGYAVAHCKAEPTGALTRCVVAKELPTGHGFGKAAVALAPRFRVSAEAMTDAPRGAPIEVDVPIRFPPAAEAKDRTVRSPVWRTGFDPQTQLQGFPVAAARPNSPGAVVRCDVGAEGALTNCAIELTSPDGIDFDEAAVKLASRLRMSLWSAEAGPVQGGVVHLPVRVDIAARESAQR
jgi:TonB family protein